jgi:hypothetical protein
MGVCSFSLDGPSLLCFIGRRFLELEQKSEISFVSGTFLMFAQVRKVSSSGFFDPTDLNLSLPTPI